MGEYDFLIDALERAKKLNFPKSQHVFMIKTEITLEDILNTRNVDGAFFVNPVIYPNNNVGYSAICINPLTNSIHYGNTYGDTIDCMIFKTLVELKVNNSYYKLICHNDATAEFHDFMVLQYYKLWMYDSYYLNQRYYNNDYLLNIQNGHYFKEDGAKYYIHNDVINVYESILNKYPDINQNIKLRITKQLNDWKVDEERREKNKRK